VECNGDGRIVSQGVKLLSTKRFLHDSTILLIMPA
jgi:hypothetical protein